MQAKEKLVSIFVPYYNDRTFLWNSIDSILNQSYKKFELILLDHASTDNSPQIAHSYTDQRIKHISLSKNLGAGGGVLLNEFLNVAKGEYIKLFCADDVMRPDCIANFIDYMEEHPHVDVVFGNIQYVNQYLKLSKDNWFNNRQDFNINDSSIDLLRKFKYENVLPYIGNFARKKAYENIRINKTFIIMFDMSLWLEMLLNGRNFAFMDKIVAYYRIHENQVASAKNLESISAYTVFESMAYYDIFYSHTENIDMMRAIFAESPFIKKINKEDKDLMEFVIAHYFLTHEYNSSKKNSYIKIEKMLSDDKLRNRIEARFSYGIAEFREDYVGKNIRPLSFKRKIYKKHPENLNIVELFFLFLRNLWDIISLKSIRKRKKYTV